MRFMINTHVKMIRDPRKAAACLLLAGFLLNSCGPTEAEIAAQTAEASTAIAAAWTPTPTHTPTDTFTPTLTLTPIATPTQTPTVTPTELPFPVYVWRTLLVDEVKKGPHLDMAVDSEDVPHIVYLDDLETTSIM